MYIFIPATSEVCLQVSTRWRTQNECKVYVYTYAHTWKHVTITWINSLLKQVVHDKKRARLTTTTLCKHIHVLNLISWNKHERTYSTKHHLKLHIYVFVFFPLMRAMHFKLRLFHSSPTLWDLSQWSFAPGGASDLYHVSNWQILNSHATFWRGASQTSSDLHHVKNNWYQLKQ